MATPNISWRQKIAAAVEAENRVETPELIDNVTVYDDN